MALFSISKWVLASGVVFIAACGPATRQERAVEHAEGETVAAERNAERADDDVARSRAAEDVLEENDPAAIAEANRILEATPDKDPSEE